MGLSLDPLLDEGNTILAAGVVFANGNWGDFASDKAILLAVEFDSVADKDGDIATIYYFFHAHK